MSAESTASLVSTMLHEYGHFTRAALQDYLVDREPRRYLYDLVTDYPRRGGKMMRPSLCIAAARALWRTDRARAAHRGSYRVAA